MNLTTAPMAPAHSDGDVLHNPAHPLLCCDAPSVARSHPEHACGVIVTALGRRPFSPAVETIDITARELAMAEQQDRARFDAAVAEGIDAIPDRIVDLVYVYAKTRSVRGADRFDISGHVRDLLKRLGCEAH